MEVGVDEPELPHQVAIGPRCLMEVGPQYARPVVRTGAETDAKDHAGDREVAKKSRCEDISLVHTQLPEYATIEPGGATDIGEGSTPGSSAVLLELRAS